MRKILLAILAVGLIAIARPSLTQLIEIKAEKFIEYITVADPYREWQTWPGTNKLYRGRALYGHGAFVTTYVNLTALRSISGKSSMAGGSIIVMENYNADKKLEGLMTMYKVKGFNPEAGDWYWVEAKPEGTVLSSGKTGACIDCHRAQAKNDYIWTGEVVQGKYDKMATGDDKKD